MKALQTVFTLDNSGISNFNVHEFKNKLNGYQPTQDVIKSEGYFFTPEELKRVL
jgi:hypothetical protein